MYHRTWMLKYGPAMFSQAEKGFGGGAPANGTVPGADDDGDKATSDGKSGDTPEEKKFTQKELDAIFADRLAREKKKQDEATAKLKKQAEEDALVKNQEYQKLADERGKRVAELEGQVGELETVRTQAERYKGALETYLQAEKKDLPKHVLTLLEKLDPVDQIEYISANREQLGKSNEGPQGVPPSPNPRERKLSESEQDEARKGQSSLYSRF
jgi:hypothetical protein